MKKILSLALAFTLVFAMAIPAMADNETSGSTKLTYTVKSNYSITIPASIDLAADASRVLTGTGSFSVNSGSLIDAGKSLKMAITNSNGYSDSKFILKNTSKNTVTLPYTISDGENVTQGDAACFLTATADQAFTGVTKTLTVTSEAYTQAGEYTDTLTITVSLA